MNDPLVLCPSCARHVRTSERACPFCAAALPSGLAATAVGVPTARLSRAALMVFGATLAFGAACQRNGGGSTETIAQPYGAPPMPAPPDTGPTAIVQPYGAPPNPRPDPDPSQQQPLAADAGASHAADAGTAHDPAARHHTTGPQHPRPDHGTVQAAYGAPPNPGPTP